MRNAVTTISLLGLAGLSLLGCLDRTISKVNPQQGRVEYKDIPVTVNRNIDILFVVDDSPSMLDKQTNLRNNFPNFINVLNTIEGGLPDIHLGVISSDVGTTPDGGTAGPGIGSGPGACTGAGKNGNLITAAGITGSYIVDTRTATGRMTNYSGTLQDAFTSITMLVGASGCGFEQHLHAAKRALSNNPMNAGFLRPDAYLAIIFIQDEDDCSMASAGLVSSDTSTLGPLQSFRCNRYGHVCTVGGTTPDQMNQVGPKSGCSSNEASMYLSKVQSYVDFFKGLKPGKPENVIVAGIAGPTTPYAVELRTPPGGGSAIPAVAHSCSYMGAVGLEVADPSVRLKQFLDSFPNRTTFSTICQTDLSGALVQIAELLRLVIGTPCIGGNLADVDPNTPGDQYDCQVSDVTNFGKANQTEVILPQCNSTDSNTPCWKIITDLANCAGGEHLKIEIVRTQMPPPETHVISYCVTEA